MSCTMVHHLCKMLEKGCIKKNCDESFRMPIFQEGIQTLVNSHKENMYY